MLTPSTAKTMMETFSPFLALQTLLLMLLLHALFRFYRMYQKFSTRKKSLPFPNIPYTVPNPHWYIGHLRAIGSDVIRGQELATVTHASPNGISTFWTFNTPCLSFLRADDVNTVLRYSFHREHVPSLAYHFKKLLGQHSLIMTVGKEWMSNRAVVHRAFTPAAMRDARVVMCDVSRRFVQSILLTIKRHDQIAAVAEDDIDDDDNVNPSRPAAKWTVEDITTLVKPVTLDIFGLAALGHDFQSTAGGKISEKVVSKSFGFLCNDMTRRTFDMSNRFNPAAQFYWIPTPLNRKFKRENARLRGLLLDIINEKREKVKNEKDETKQKKKTTERVDDLLSRILRMQDTENKKENLDFTDDFLSDFLLTLLFAGHDTTSLSLVYVLYLLAQHPEQEKRCVEEARSVLGWNNGKTKNGNNGNGEKVNEDDNGNYLLPPAPQHPSSTYGEKKTTNNDDEDDDEYVLDPIKELPYTHAVMLEALRFYPPVTNVVRDLGRPMEIEIDGKQTTVPIGTRVFMSLYWIQRHNENFARPNEFLPERWVRWNEEQKCWEERNPNDEVEVKMAKEEKERIEKAQIEGKEATWSNYIPPAERANLLSFSAGGRVCVGQRFAMQETPIILAYFVRDIKAELVDKDFELELIRSGPTQMPKSGVPMILSQRL